MTKRFEMIIYLMNSLKDMLSGSPDKANVRGNKREVEWFIRQLDGLHRLNQIDSRDMRLLLEYLDIGKRNGKGEVCANTVIKRLKELNEVNEWYRKCGKKEIGKVLRNLVVHGKISKKTQEICEDLLDCKKEENKNTGMGSLGYTSRVTVTVGCEGGRSLSGSNC